MKITIEFSTDNAAFEDGEEAGRIVKRAASMVAGGYREGQLTDSNGNRVGNFSVKYKRGEKVID